jgi:3-phytase
VKAVPQLKRPNNVDVEYGLMLGGRAVDIAVITERLGDTIRVFRVPALQPIDGGGIPVFVGQSQRAPAHLTPLPAVAGAGVLPQPGAATGVRPGTFQTR